AALLVACRPGNAVDRGAVDNRRDLRDRAGGIAADVGHLDPLERNVSAADVLPKLHRLRAEDDVVGAARRRHYVGIGAALRRREVEAVDAGGIVDAGPIEAP